MPRQVVLEVFPRTLVWPLHTLVHANAVPVAAPSAGSEDWMLRGTANQLPTPRFEGERKRDE